MNREAAKFIARVKRIAGVLGARRVVHTLDEGRVDVVVLELSEVELPVVEEGGMPAPGECATKAWTRLRGSL